jgi:uncharacterized membrane protein YhaH (DUF805 family)
VDELALALHRALQLPPKSTASHASTNRETSGPSWTDFLFSFEGRISRKSFWLSGLCLAGVSYLFMIGLAAALGTNILESLTMPNRRFSSVYSLALLPFYWPTFALFLKRLHDFGQGKGGLWPLVILSVLSAALPVGVPGTDEYEVQTILGIAMVVMMLFVGCTKGTTGSNQYGPDPLASNT